MYKALIGEYGIIFISKYKVKDLKIILNKDEK